MRRGIRRPRTRHVGSVQARFHSRSEDRAGAAAMESSFSASAGSFKDSPPASPVNRQRWSSEVIPGSQEARQAAEEYQRGLARSSRSTVKVLNPSCVSKTYVMTLPAIYAKRNMPRGKAAMIVRYKSVQWQMNWHWINQPVIGRGWKAFCNHNRLVKGDVIVLTKEESPPTAITFEIKIFKRDDFVKRTEIPLLQPKREDEGRRNEEERMKGPIEKAWPDNSSDEDANDAPGIRRIADHKRARPAMESEELRVRFKLHKSALENVSRNLLGSASIIENTDGVLQAKVSRGKVLNILPLTIPL